MCNVCNSESPLIWEKKSISIGDRQGTYKDLTYYFCDDCGEVFDINID